MDDPRVEDALPGYEVRGELGRGAMGEVLAGHHVRLERSVAIKRLPPVFADDPAVRARFAAEAKVLASLDHPHVVPVYDYVEEHGLCLLVMQSLPGGTVWDRFSEEGLSMPAACAVVVTACAGLHHAHRKKVLHRDVKPENLMFDEGHVLKVTDFGIAAVIGGDETLATLDGQVIGTPAYMAPEQAEGGKAGPQADVYAAGTMLYELLSGRLPFSDEGGALALLGRRVSEAPVPLSEVAPTVPLGVASAAMMAIETRAEDRFATAEDFGVALAEAATEAWGPDWLSHTELPLLSGDAIAFAAKPTQSRRDTLPRRDDHAAAGPRATGPAPGTRLRHEDPRREAADTRETVGRNATPAAPRVAETLAPGGAGDADVEARSSRPDGTLAPGRARAAKGAPPTQAPGNGGRPGPPPPSMRVMPTMAPRPAAVDIGDVDQRDLVPLSDILTPPARPTIALMAAALLGLALTVVAVLGLGGSGGSDDLRRGQVFVDGQDVTTSGGVDVDLGAPIELRVADDVEGAALIRIDTSVLGLSTGSSSIEELDPGPDGRTAAVDASSLRKVTSGDLAAEVTLTTSDGEVLGEQTFTLGQRSPQLLNAATITAAVLTLFVGVYFASTTRPLRLGRRRRSAYLGLVPIGVFGAFAALLWGWGLAGPVPTTASAAAAAVIGAGLAPVVGWCLFVRGRRRRLRRASPPRVPV